MPPIRTVRRGDAAYSGFPGAVATRYVECIRIGQLPVLAAFSFHPQGGRHVRPDPFPPRPGSGTDPRLRPGRRGVFGPGGGAVLKFVTSLSRAQKAVLFLAMDLGLIPLARCRRCR